MSKRLKYEKYNNSENVIEIDLQNGFSVISLSTYDSEIEIYIVTLLIKDNTVDTWKLIEGAERLEFNATSKTINSAILKFVASELENGFFDYYIDRYNYEMKCFDLGDEILELERLSDTNV